jgi:hypothetical protein
LEPLRDEFRFRLGLVALFPFALVAAVPWWLWPLVVGSRVAGVADDEAGVGASAVSVRRGSLFVVAFFRGVPSVTDGGGVLVVVVVVDFTTVAPLESAGQAGLARGAFACPDFMPF